jgi:AcrR family transcriptional regulator
MSSIEDSTARRRRDAEDARRRLLAAADELIAERGYDRATTREIGKRAHVDAALIARYFGNKAGLYLAAMRQPHSDQDRVDLTNVDSIARLIHRADGHDAGPRPGSRLYAVLQPHADHDVQRQAMAYLEQRLISTAEQHAQAAGLDRPRLRAEVATAALIGVLLSRPTGALHELATADPDTIAQILTDLLAATTGLAPDDQ